MMPRDYSPYYGITFNLPWLADDLADDLAHEHLIEFILKMDERKADLDFTQRLYVAIGDELRKELEADERT